MKLFFFKILSKFLILKFTNSEHYLTIIINNAKNLVARLPLFFLPILCRPYILKSFVKGQPLSRTFSFAEKMGRFFPIVIIHLFYLMLIGLCIDAVQLEFYNDLINRQQYRKVCCKMLAFHFIPKFC